ncbi:RrF2 family transcriptional regulator [Amycolatopsis taiwanensis]|uniref:Rrf2 family transcriptional regulator n=1 Tax=Amycolatopsis taiwanensis TaxID=342230 RepID=A0A9W6R965_9PSEU|nr:Rrf2 family transcriptional regulator [Amycolatopsis taiwanensis]GLY71659.1 Rrf2 family transcriptional regulator [Amycolatopsis taiwanensis]
MKLSQGVEWALHCAVTLADAEDGILASRRTLAGYYGLPEAYLAKHLKSLVQAGVLVAASGPRGGFRLARAPEQITVLDVVEAIEGSAPSFVCTEIRQRGACALPPDRCTGPCPVARIMLDADRAWRDSLRAVTLADLSGQLPEWAHARAGSWLADPSKPLPPVP